MGDDIERLRKAVKEAFAHSARTLKRLPMPAELAQLVGAVKPWPVLHDRSEHGAWDRPRLRPKGATPKEIENLNRCVEWIWGLQGDKRQVALARFCGYSFRAIAAVNGGKSWWVYQRRFEDAVTEIVVRLLTEK